MTILDANILLYAYTSGAPEYEQMREWLEGLLSGPEQIGIPWITVWAFIRIGTSAKLNRLPGPAKEAFEQVRMLLSQPRVKLIHPGARHLDLLEQAAMEAQAFGPHFTDAALAALAIEHGASLASTDRDFSRFPGLRWVNPLARA